MRACALTNIAPFATTNNHEEKRIIQHSEKQNMADEVDSSVKKSLTSLAEVEETIARISSYKGVQAVMILHRQTGNVIQSTWTEDLKLQHASIIQQLTSKSALLASTMDDELSFVRIRSKQHEILLAPDKEYILAVLQNPLSE